ncbi:Rrf2 family transcriptional regulator [Noviherbaspirillum sp. 1P10PC]|uniref:RrF2 family transcriptional regulator n=1 Tax=Noviherbaspirillum sp. 1P10PC TaxID=3132292 RepID=UPI00399EF766
MRLTDYTDYAFKVLMYLAIHRNRLVTVQEIASAHQIPRSQIAKVVHRLGRAGLLDTSRGRGGGMRLGVAPDAIRLGDVARLAESDFAVVECFNDASNQCRLSPVCVLKHVLAAATAAYLQQLDQLTLDDIVAGEGPATAQSRVAGMPGPGFRQERDSYR